MLRIGINLIKADYNRETLIVHHLTDNVTGQPLPVCGTDIDDMTDGGDADGLLADIKRRREPLFSDDSSRMCRRCKAIYLAPSTEELKSKRRLARWKRKEARRKLVGQYERQIIEQRLGECPRCQRKVELQEPRGYHSAEASCEACDMEWEFTVSAEADGSFTVWADDETGKLVGFMKGHIKLEAAEWNWGRLSTQ